MFSSASAGGKKHSLNFSRAKRVFLFYVVKEPAPSYNY
nr:MAG TPA: hypothetical protein [Caudoviricetes sp.]